MKEWIKRLLLLLLVFHYIYPQALAIAGSSFIIASGVIGLGLYIFHKLPFSKELSILFIAYLAYMFVAYTSAYINMYYVGWYSTLGLARSQLAWVFSAYLIIFLIFTIHDNPTPTTVAYYIVLSLVLQTILTLLMHSNEAINKFLYSIELQNLWEANKERFEEERLIGHASYLFGGGAIFGYGLIFCGYILAKGNLKNFRQFFLLAIAYVLILYVGIFTARTTLVGAGVSLALIIIYYILDYNKTKSKVLPFLGSLLILIIVGYSICLAYFPHMANWAFELFYNFMNNGELTTQSSQALGLRIGLPDTLQEVIIGRGVSEFFLTDVGFTRLIYYVGISGMVLYFFYTMVIAKMSMTKDIYINVLIVALVFYQLILNYKGWIEINNIFYLIFMYFMFYKYYRFYPRIYAQKMKQYKNNENYIHNI